MNVSVACIPASLVVIYLMRIPVARAQAGTGKYDNNNPRDQQASLTGLGKRALAAHMNGFEGFPAFGLAVLAANYRYFALYSDEPPLGSPVTILSLSYVVSRVVYSICYLADRARLRSAVWIAGFGMILALFALALTA